MDNTKNTVKDNGKVREIKGTVVEAENLSGNIGELCYIIPEDRKKEPVRAEITGFRENRDFQTYALLIQQ